MRCNRCNVVAGRLGRAGLVVFQFGYRTQQLTTMTE